MRNAATLGGAILAATGASACCLGPLLFGALGLGAFGLGASFERWRPLLIAATALLLAAGFYLAYRRTRPAAAGTTLATEDCECAPAPRGIRSLRNRILLWTAAVVVAILVATPYFI